MVLKNIAPPPGKIVTLADGREIRVFPIGGKMARVDALLSSSLKADESDPRRQNAMKAQTGLYLAYATGQDVDREGVIADLLGLGSAYFEAFADTMDADDIHAVITAAVKGGAPLGNGSQSQTSG